MNVHSRETSKRERILAAALQIFAANGVHGTAVPPIAGAAGVGVGTLYHYFTGKEELVNAVFRETKNRLQSRLLGNLPVIAPSKQLFDEIWHRLAAFAKEEPDAFRFLEMQDHYSYLDSASQKDERRLLSPLRSLVEQGQKSGVFNASLRPEIAIALFWGAFVGLFKSERLGYIKVSKADVLAARDTCWKLLAP